MLTACVSTGRSKNLHNPGMGSVLENFAGLRTGRLASLNLPTQIPTQIPTHGIHFCSTVGCSARNSGDRYRLVCQSTVEACVFLLLGSNRPIVDSEWLIDLPAEQVAIKVRQFRRFLAVDLKVCHRTRQYLLLS